MYFTVKKVTVIFKYISDEDIIKLIYLINMLKPVEIEFLRDKK